MIAQPAKAISIAFLLRKIIFFFCLIVASLVSFSQYTFPLRISADKRYLQDHKGKPFPILGRTAWCIISQPVSGQHKFIEHTKSFGYDAIEMSALCHWRDGNHAPFNGKGDLPFLKKVDGSDWKDSLDFRAGKFSPDFTTPNESYWKYMDEFIAYCEKNGILIFFFPAYVGYHNGDQGWMEEMVANGPDKVRAYGEWIAKRYRNAKNLVWMLLGDDGKFNPGKKDAEAALIAGLKSVPNQQSIYYSAESTSGENSADNEFFGKEMTLNAVYNWVKDIPAQGRRAYAREPLMPSFLLEEPYDEEGPDGNNYNPHAVQPVRRFQWWGWLSAIGGYVAGNGFIWPFIDPHWQQHLNSNGAKDMRVLNGFIKSINWWKLVPSGMNGMEELVVGNVSDTLENYIAAAATKDGSLLIAYLPPHHSGNILIDVSIIKDGTAFWFDPTNGNYQQIRNVNGAKQNQERFDPPASNGRGDHDWVLVIRKPVVEK